jgi:fructokinase
VRLGIDLGGTKIEALALGGGGEARYRRRIDTPAGDYGATVEAIAGLVEEAEHEVGERCTLGIAAPGAISLATGRIKNANSTWLNNRPLQSDLEARLDREIRIANDANCFALSEAVDGAASDARIVFGVILGTGVGGGIVVDRKVLTGANAIAGEWGHNPLPAPTERDLPPRECYCGRRGCIETYLSGPALSHDHAEHARIQKSAREISTAAAHDPESQATLDRYIERLARALASVINVLDPDVIVLGGGLSNIDALYERVPRAWGRYIFSDQVRTRISKPLHGDASGVRGAAWLWDEPAA